MNELLIYTLPGIAIGFVIGWVVRDYVRQAQQDLVASDRDLDRAPHINYCTCTVVTGGHRTQDVRCPVHASWQFCPRCGRSDGTHTSACERARLDVFVAPVSPARRRTERHQ